MGRTRGIHWIVTTHGTWLHGDVRGSWLNGKLIGPDLFLEECIRARMTADAITLDPVERILVAMSFGQTVIEKRWRVLAATIQSTHCHILFAPLPDPIDQVIATLKYRSACAVLKLRRQMRRTAGRSLWTEGQFPVFIYSDNHLANAIEYVRDHNRRQNRPADPYDWIQKPTRDGSAL